jgi:hypothetical protein
MPIAIYEILENTSKLKTEQEKIAFLQEHADNTALQTIIVGALVPEVRWALPPGNPPYTPCDPVNSEGFLYSQAKRLYIFAEGGSNLPNLRREALFIELLESVHPKDAEMILAMKDKTLPYGITPQLINKAFPGLLNNEEQV